MQSSSLAATMSAARVSMASAAARSSSLRASPDIPASDRAALRVCRTSVEASEPACMMVLLMRPASVIVGCAFVPGQKILPANQQALRPLMASVEQIAELSAAAGGDAFADGPSLGVFHGDHLP